MKKLFKRVGRGLFRLTVLIFLSMLLGLFALAVLFLIMVGVSAVLGMLGLPIPSTFSRFTIAVGIITVLVYSWKLGGDGE